MLKSIAIIAGEPNSISSEIIFKFWKSRKKFYHKPIFIIGGVELLNRQFKKLKYKIPIKEINFDFKIKNLTGNKLPVYNVKYKQSNPFQKISTKSNKYIFKSFNVALKFFKKKKILGLINCPVAKESLFKKKYQSVTEFLSKKLRSTNNEVMLIYNKELSVSPLTTHIPLSRVSSKLNRLQIFKKIKTINDFYKKYFNKNPNIAILGLNRHNFSNNIQSERKKLFFLPLIWARKKESRYWVLFLQIQALCFLKKNKFDVIFGMYHDQVLTPFKALFKFNDINITLGLPFIRISPDHGVAYNITGKKIGNPDSLINSIKFFNYINK